VDPAYHPHAVEWTREKAGRLWDFLGGRPSADVLYFGTHSGRSVVRYLGRRITLRDRKVLDYGCGRGAILSHLLDAGAWTTGLEFSQASAQAAASRVSGFPRARGVELVSRLPCGLPDREFDVVVMVEVVEHLLETDLEPTLLEVRRLTRPGGQVLVTTPYREDLAASSLHCPDCGATFHQWQHVRSFDEVTLAALMARVGFEKVVCEALFFEPERRLLGRVVGALQGLLSWLRGTPRRPHLAYLGRLPA
jgi:2-polyprenyl-3-methyl-5-hydroxy-6-metoxy-1,4-benzoquinol methylase